MALPRIIGSMIPMKKYIGKFDNITPNQAPQQTITFQVNTAWNYLDIWLRTLNLTIAMIQQVRLKVGGETIQKWAGADLDARLQYDRQPAFATNGILKLPLRRMGIRGGMQIQYADMSILSGAARDLAYETSLNCGSEGGGFAKIAEVTIEIDLIDTLAQPTVQVYGRVTAPVDGGPGAVYRVDRQIKVGAIGNVTINKAEMGIDALRPFLNRITIVPPAGGTIDNILLRYGTNDWWQLPSNLLDQSIQEDDLRTLQAGYRVIDFQEEGFGDEMLDLSSPNADISLSFDLAGAGGNIIYYMEYAGLPSSPNPGR